MHEESARPSTGEIEQRKIEADKPRGPGKTYRTFANGKTVEVDKKGKYWFPIGMYGKKVRQGAKIKKCPECGNEFPALHETAITCSNSCGGKRGPKPKGDPERFWRFFEKRENGCWEWKNWLNNRGYGVFCVERKNQYAHRYSWELHNGKIPEGKFVCHKCDNPKCVNPDHLFLGVAKIDVRDCISKGRFKYHDLSQYKNDPGRISRLKRGEENSSSKLTEEQVREIKTSPRKGWMRSQLAERFGVRKGTVTNIQLGYGWKHLNNIC